MFRLSAEGEVRLKKSLYDTLSKQIQDVISAYENGDVQRVRQIGHSLRGNSGAEYFKLHRVGEIGQQLNQFMELHPTTFHALRTELETIVERLRSELESS